MGILTHIADSPHLGWIRRLWDARVSLWLLVRSDLHGRYSKYRLGYLWSFISPVLQIVVLWAVFSLLLGRERGLGYEPFLLFVATGILPWSWAQATVGAASRVNSRMGARFVTSGIPRRAWPLEIVAVGFVRFLIVSPLYLLFAAVTAKAPSPWILVGFPAAILLQTILLYGLALLIMPVVTKTPDYRNIISAVTQVFFYASPIIYSTSRVPEWLQPYTILNPLTGILSLYRVGFWPDEALLPWTAYAFTAAICIGILVLGLLFFKRMETRMVRELL